METRGGEEEKNLKNDITYENNNTNNNIMTSHDSVVVLLGLRRKPVRFSSWSVFFLMHCARVLSHSWCTTNTFNSTMYASRDLGRKLKVGRHGSCPYDDVHSWRACTIRSAPSSSSSSSPVIFTTRAFNGTRGDLSSQMLCKVFNSHTVRPTATSDVIQINTIISMFVSMFVSGLRETTESILTRFSQASVDFPHTQNLEKF